MHTEGKEKTRLFAKYCQVYETNIVEEQICFLLSSNHINYTGSVFYQLMPHFQREA